MPARRHTLGFTLIEVIIAIVVVGVSLAAVMSVFIVTSQHSADPMERQQAQMIAEAYLDEILLKRFYDPDTGTICPSPEGSRSAFDNVCDYNNILNQAPADQTGVAISELSSYKVSVSVDSGSVDLNGVNNTGVTRVLLVTVTVTGPNNTSVTLASYRTNYECNTAGDPECK
jgi:MSHA pilin protein MshD